MKIAVLCCGQLRAFLDCKESIEKHVLSKNNCSLFLYTDTEIASKNTIQWSGNKYNLPKKGLENLYKESIQEITNLVKKYNCNEENSDKESDVLDRIKIEPHFKLEVPNWWDAKTVGSFEGSYFNSFNKQQAFFLLQDYIKKYNFNFDYVLYIRPDILFYEDIDIEKEIKNLPELEMENKLNTEGYIVMYSLFEKFRDRDSTIKASTMSRNNACDVIFCSTVNSLSKFMPTIVDDVISAFKEMEGINQKGLFCYETAFWLSLYKRNISRYVLFRDYQICRMVRKKFKFSSLLNIRIKKTSTRISLLRNIRFRTLMISVVIFSYPIYLQIFSDKKIYIENWYETERR